MTIAFLELNLKIFSDWCSWMVCIQSDYCHGQIKMYQLESCFLFVAFIVFFCFYLKNLIFYLLFGGDIFNYIVGKGLMFHKMAFNR